MSLLSDDDIKKELGKNIFIYPLISDCIKGSSINLRASKLAWSLKTKKSIFNNSHNKIIIPPNDTALIETEESLFVTNKISGSYHSKVKLVSQGIGHIGTTLDPEWIGPSLIALHNYTNSKIEIKLNDSFVSIMFYYLKSKSKKTSTNTPGRPELLNGFNLTNPEKNWLDEEWRQDPNKLKKKMLECDEYKKIKHERKSKFYFLKAPIIINLLCLLLCVIVAFILYKFKQKLGFSTKDYLIPIICVYLTVLTTQIMKIIHK